LSLQLEEKSMGNIYIYGYVIQENVFEFEQSAFSETKWSIWPRFLPWFQPEFVIHECFAANRNTLEKEFGGGARKI
jgi:hypothetical protein